MWASEIQAYCSRVNLVSNWDLVSCPIMVHSELLQKQIGELKEKSTAREYVIKRKLQEKDEQIHGLAKKQEKIEQFIQSLIDSGQLKPLNNLQKSWM